MSRLRGKQMVFILLTLFELDHMLTKAGFRETVAEMLRRAETTLPGDVTRALRLASKREQGIIARLQFTQMLKNLDVARKFKAPICQDTGTFTFFIQFGRELELNFDLERTLNEAVAQATREVPLRANVVDPITRKPARFNTGKFQPAVHIELVEGKKLQLDLLVKGAGTENWGRLFMLRPGDGPRAIERAVLLTLAEAGGKPCPPTVVGVGVGGAMETAPLLAKRALLRPLDRQNPDATLAKLERQIERAANRINIGPMGLGGRSTVLRVLIENAACHTASLPVAVALQCWPARRASAKLVGGNLRIVEP